MSRAGDGGGLHARAHGVGAKVPFRRRQLPWISVMWLVSPGPVPVRA